MLFLLEGVLFQCYQNPDACHKFDVEGSEENQYSIGWKPTCVRADDSYARWQLCQYNGMSTNSAGTVMRPAQEVPSYSSTFTDWVTIDSWSSAGHNSSTHEPSTNGM